MNLNTKVIRISQIYTQINLEDTTKIEINKCYFRQDLEEKCQKLLNNNTIVFKNKYWYDFSHYSTVVKHNQLVKLKNIYKKTE